MTQLWICGKFLDHATQENPLWEFQGVFSSEDLAKAACRTERYFIAPAELDEQVPDETVEWPGCYLPKLSAT